MPHLHDCSLGEILFQAPDLIVRQVKHASSGESYVVKMSVPGVSNQKAIGRLIHEHQVLVKLADVPGVVRTRGIQHDGAQVVLWLEDQGLRSLDRILAERRHLPMEPALRMARDLSLTLQRIHAAGVVHKDIKPQNILWDETQQHATLLDFAIASELSEEATNAAIPEALEGTLTYMSPEQTGRTARGVDARTDIYSLGIVLFELLFGRQPFVETDPLALVHAHLAKSVPPLDKLVPGLPPIVARIVERCLEKHPEKRYQTAKGLAADLETCLVQYGECDEVEEFPLGRRDFSPSLRIPQTLVSREHEVAEIKASFDRTASGAVELLLLGGPSGVGKTALVRSVYQEIAQAGRGLLLSGKHDQLGRSVPYAALAQAFGGLFRDLAGSPKAIFDAWRRRLDEAVGPLSRVIADIVPEMEWLMGELAPVPVVPTEMTYNRFKLSWIEFVRAVADASPPLVLFLDDMQWVDPASLELLKVLLTDAAKKNLLVIAAYRDNEVDATHPLWSLIEALGKADVQTPRLTLGVLDENAVRTWLSVALLTNAASVASLAKTLQAKTLGNPFFLGQLLLELHRQKRVQRNLDTGKWEWDQNAVEQAAITDNVVELMGQKVMELPMDTQLLLGQAACAGHSFSLSELAILAGLEQTKVARDLRPSLLAGLVIPQDGQYREVQAMGSEQSGLDANYRFLHDRVQQAFYEHIDLDKRAQTHLVIGRRLQVAFDKYGGGNQKLLELTRHMNLGAAALSSDEDRQMLARLNLRAAKAAKENGSYQLQAHLVEQAQTLLGEGAWQDEPTLSVELALERLEADYMLREFEQIHCRAQELLTLSLPDLARLAIKQLQVRTYLTAGQYAQGERLGLDALAENGIIYPQTDEECIALARDSIAFCDHWIERNPHGFRDMHADSSTRRFLYDTLEADTGTCAAHGHHSALASYIAITNTRRAVELQTLTPATPFHIAYFASARSAILEEYRGSVRWAREGERTGRQVQSPLYPECAYTRAKYEAYEVPAAHCHEFYGQSLNSAMTSGSIYAAGIILVAELLYLTMWRGCPIREVVEAIRSRRQTINGLRHGMGQQVLDAVENYTNILAGSSDFLLAHPTVGTRTHSERLNRVGHGYTAEAVRVLETHLYLSSNRYHEALDYAEAAQRDRIAQYGNPTATDIPLWRGLAASKCWSSAFSHSERQSHLEKLDHGINRLQYFAEGCPENFLHKLRLLEAEHARIHGRIAEAMAKYDEAIDVARQQGFLHIEGLAAHFCADFFLELGRKRQATMYLREACDAYQRWDAWALVAHLEAKYSELIAPRARDLHSSRPTSSAPTGETASPVALDIHTAIRAAQALSGELDPNRVVGRLMDLCVANAGAERGALVLTENEALVLVARLSVHDNRIETDLSLPLAQCNDIATTVIRYVARSREALVVNDVLSEKRFSDDPYLTTNSVRSLLALPLTYRGRLDGVLYLEHQKAPSAFPASRVELLSVIASQAAIAVENAQLYQNIEAQLRALEARNREVQKLNDELRRQIAQRSRRLMETLISSDGETPIASLEVGSILGDCYRIVKMLGEGGMGAVYEVERTTDGEHLAAKVLNHSPDRNDLGRFAREAQILAKLSHPNLISIYDIDVTDDGVLYIVMELVQGATLRQIEGRRGDIPWILQVLGQIAKALDALHSISIVHRDLKPENVLVVSLELNAVPVVKLADFGISIITTDPRSSPPVDPHAITLSKDAPMSLISIDRASMLTQSGVLVGTPLYMAPELGYGSKNALPSSDMFALGIIAYELLIGEKPYAFPPALGGMISDNIPAKLQQCANLPADWADLIARCLEIEPDKRPKPKEISDLEAGVLQSYRPV